MIGTVPPIPDGSGRLPAFCRWVRESILALQPMPAPGAKLYRSTRGFSYAPLPHPAPAQPGGKLTVLKITALHNTDSVIARVVSSFGPPVTTSGDDVTVAKDFVLRPSVTSEVIDGVTINYTFRQDNSRVASDGTNTEIQVMFPRYKVGGIIFAMEVDGIGTNAGTSWLEVKPARVWARRYTQ